MSRTLIGTVAYGGLPFLRILVEEIAATTIRGDTIVVVAKPGDQEMWDFLFGREINLIQHTENKGFPASINDLCDAAFVNGSYDNLIICGNDTVPMRGAIDAMIDCADSTDWETVSASEFDARFLASHYPEASKCFHPPNLSFTDFNARPWEIHFTPEYRPGQSIEPNCFKDIRNMALFKRSSFEKVGYDDVNYWPNGYYADNDYCRRCVLSGVKSAGLQPAEFFHFWSRTIHQGEARPNSVYFERNRAYYIQKWGGEPNQERYALPFDGKGLQLTPEIFLKPEINIQSRDQEPAIIEYWAKL
jgi:GT2 family glycosyltransferase